MNRPDAGLHRISRPHMRASTDAGGPKFQLAWLGLCRRNELPDTSDTGGFACDQHVGLAGKWSDRNKILQWARGQVGSVRLSSFRSLPCAGKMRKKIRLHHAWKPRGIRIRPTFIGREIKSHTRHGRIAARTHVAEWSMPALGQVVRQSGSTTQSLELLWRLQQLLHFRCLIVFRGNHYWSQLDLFLFDRHLVSRFVDGINPLVPHLIRVLRDDAVYHAAFKQWQDLGTRVKRDDFDFLLQSFGIYCLADADGRGGASREEPSNIRISVQLITRDIHRSGRVSVGPLNREYLHVWIFGDRVIESSTALRTYGTRLNS